MHAKLGTDTRTERRRKFIINTLYWAVILALLYILFSYVIGWLLPLLIGIVIARLLNPLIRLVAKKTRIPRKLVAFVLFFLFVAVIGTLIFFLVLMLFRAVRDQVFKLPEYYNDTILPTLHQIEGWVAENLGDLMKMEEGEGFNLVGMLTNYVGSLPEAFSKVFGVATQMPTYLLRLLFTFLFTLFSTVYYEEALAFVLRQMNLKHRLFVSETIIALKRSLVSYYGGYLKIMGVTFVELLVGLSIVLGHFAILPAFFVALVDFLPVLGCGTVLIPWAIIAFVTGNTSVGVGIMVVYVIIFIVRQFIEPKIVGDQLGLNPLLMLTAMYTGFLAIGFIGIIIMPIIVTVIADLQKHKRIHVVNY
ncbi:MAG: sporulation integral membrane protein YtvI [Oscillospiraceae bacterium]|nr:sporulation integral membrane protein YtvI [Oscillospiraceae bacterium]